MSMYNYFVKKKKEKVKKKKNDFQNSIVYTYWHVFCASNQKYIVVYKRSGVYRFCDRRIHTADVFVNCGAIREGCEQYRWPWVDRSAIFVRLMLGLQDASILTLFRRDRYIRNVRKPSVKATFAFSLSSSSIFDSIYCIISDIVYIISC